VNRSSYFHPLIFTGALLTLAAQPGIAAMTTITGVQLNPTDGGLELVFDTEGGDASNIFTVSQGNTLRADITRAQLDLPNGDRFTQANPAPGISQITVIPLDANSVRVTIDGTTQAPRGEIISQADRVVLAVHNDAQAAPAPTPVPEQIATVPGPAVPAPSQPTLAQTTPAPEVLVPNPDVTIDGVPARPAPVNPVPPLLPRAVAPPVGDIAVAENQVLSNSIDLGSNQRIPRLLLRDAPAREVLALLARAANLNVVFTNQGATGQQNQDQQANQTGPTISLDIENESVQDVFNHVLRVADLQANRVGRSIYVGPRLPDGARSIVSRTLRLNQVDAIQAAGFLASLGAEAIRSVERTEVERTQIEGSDENVPDLVSTRTFTRTVIEPLTYTPEQNSSVAQPLRGLQAVADDRLNSVTIVGEAQLVSLATEYLARLDLRRRQVAVNVKIVDVNLSAIDRFGTSFSFSLGNLSFVNTGGAGVINFGGSSPSGVPTPLSPGGISSINPVASAFAVPSQLLFQIQAQITNGNAKILTDPTLVVQEGQSATVALTQEVVTNITSTISTSTPPVITTEVEKEPAGLTLNLEVERIDDNGFVTINVAPRVAAVTGTQNISTSSGTGSQLTNTIALLATREVSSGSVRLRDGQTLLLSGIIQESERDVISKVPILGDIPILGALFRSQNVESTRTEVLVMLTPYVIDDSDQAVFGYSYTPSDQMQEVLDQGSR
jgi:type IV pilus assembly protein PilQ